MSFHDKIAVYVQILCQTLALVFSLVFCLESRCPKVCKKVSNFIIKFVPEAWRSSWVLCTLTYHSMVEMLSWSMQAYLCIIIEETIFCLKIMLNNLFLDLPFELLFIYQLQIYVLLLMWSPSRMDPMERFFWREDLTGNMKHELKWFPDDHSLKWVQRLFNYLGF